MSMHTCHAVNEYESDRSPHRPAGRLGPVSGARGRSAAAAGLPRELPRRRRSRRPALARNLPRLPMDRLGQAGRRDSLSSAARGVEQATMAGKFQKVVLYQPSLWLRHLPDWTFIKTFWHFFATKQRDRKDDTLLGDADRRVRRPRHHVSSGDRLRPGAAGESRAKSPAGRRRPPSRTTSSSAGRSPARWAGSTSARASA